MAYIGEMEDRLAIRELIETYNDAVFRRDADAWINTWTEDAVWDLLGNEIPGRDTILQAWLGAMEGFSYVGFFATPGAIEVSGMSAMSRVYVRETLVMKDGSKRNIEGLYNDTYTKIDGAWKFSRRSYSILHEH